MSGNYICIRIRVQELKNLVYMLRMVVSEKSSHANYERFAVPFNGSEWQFNWTCFYMYIYLHIHLQWSITKLRQIFSNKRTLLTWRKNWHLFFRLLGVFHRFNINIRIEVHFLVHLSWRAVVNFSHFQLLPLKPLNGIQQNLTGSKISTSSTNFVFFGPIGKTRWPPWPLIGWDILDFSSETAERNSTKLDRKQDLNVLYQVCVFRPIGKQDAALVSDWLRHFRLLLWNRSMEFNETWQEARSQRPLPSLCFSGLLVYKNCCPGQSIKKVAHCTQVHVMWPFGPLVRAPPSKMREPYSNHSVRPSVCLSIRLSVRPHFVVMR